MSSQIAKVRSLRLEVEPVNVELDEDDGLQWTALQTAFPGCSGLFFKDGSCGRSAVKFDGKKFVPPGGAWNDREYFVQLGQRVPTHQFFGGYENASKQFERSVNAVQRLLGGSVFEPTNARRALTTPTKRHQVSPTHSGTESPPPDETATAVAAAKTAESIKERERLLQSADRQLSPIEQQFVDLARISTGKDTIIDQLRNDVKTATDKADEVQRELTRAREDVQKLERRVVAQEEELNILRRLSTEQTYMCDKVNELTRKLLDKDVELNGIRDDLENRLERSKTECSNLISQNLDLKARLEDTSAKLEDVEQRLSATTAEKNILEQKLTDLAPLVEAVGVEEGKQVTEYREALEISERLKAEIEKADTERQEISTQYDKLLALYDGLVKENTKLVERNTEVETQLQNHIEKVELVKTEVLESAKGNEKEWKSRETELLEELEHQAIQLRAQASMIARITEEATESARRLLDDPLANIALD